MAETTVLGGWLFCKRGSNRKFSCKMEPSRGHIIPNKGGTFRASAIRFDELNYGTGIKINQETINVNPGLDKIIECTVFDKDSAQCVILR